MKWRRVPENGGFSANTYVVWDDAATACAVIDPAADMDAIAEIVRETGAKPVCALLTHGHFDHILTLDAVRARYGVPAAVHRLDADMPTDPARNLSCLISAGFAAKPVERLLEDGDAIALGTEILRVAHTPGHTPGGITFICGDQSFALTGDALFAGSVGRTDFPGGDMDALLDGIRDRILTLPDVCVLLPGHGEATTVYDEKNYNPFVRG